MFRGFRSRPFSHPVLTPAAALLILIVGLLWQPTGFAAPPTSSLIDPEAAALSPWVATATAPPATPQPIPTVQRARLAHQPKLLDAATVLAAFDQGIATSPVIVSLQPDAEAETLAALSRLSPRAPSTADQSPVTRYYDLQDPRIREPLRASVSQVLDQVLVSLDLPGLTLTRRFNYLYGFAAQVTAPALERLLAHPQVRRVEPDRPLSVPALPTLDPHAAGPAINGAMFGAMLPPQSTVPTPTPLAEGTQSPTMAALISQWEGLIDRLDADGDPPPPVLGTGLGGQVAQGPGPCDAQLPTLAQAAVNARAAGISLFAPAGDEGDCTALSWPACLAAVNAVGVVYAADQGLVGWCVNAASCAAKTADDTCATGYLALEVALADQVPAASNSTAALALLAPADPALTQEGTEGTPAATAAALAAATALQKQAWDRTGTYLSPAEVSSLLQDSGAPITDTKSGITTPRIDLPRSLELLSTLAEDDLDRAGERPILPLSIDPNTGGVPNGNRGIDAASTMAIDDSIAADTGTPTTCPPDHDVDLVDQYVTDTRIYQACVMLAAGPFTVAGTGNVTFEVGQSARLRPGFKVAQGGRLIVRVSSGLATSPGALQVTINPTEAIAAGAQWRRSGSPTWRDSGNTETGLAVGEYQVEFKPIAGWVTPPTATINISPAATTALDSLYRPVPIDEPITVALPPSQTQGLTLTSLSEEGVDVADQQIAVPSNTQSLVFLTDSEDNLAGVGISNGDGSAITIDATSTAIGLVRLVYPGWGSLSRTAAEVEARIRAATGFTNLVNLIAARQQTDATSLLDDPDIVTAITDVVIEVLQTVAAQGLEAQGAAATWPDAPWVESGKTIRNPRYVPYGLSARNSYQNFTTPFILDEREFSWEFDWVPIQPSDPTAATFVNLSQGKVCAVRFDPINNFFGFLMRTSPEPGFSGKLLVGNYESLNAYLYSLPADQGLYRRAQLNGVLSWTVSILINVAKSVPGAAGPTAGAFATVLWNEIKNGGDILAFTSDIADEGLDVLIPLVLEYAYKTRVQAGSLLRKTAKVIFNDATKIRKLGIITNTLAKVFSVPDYVTDIWFAKDTLLAPVSACYVVEGGNAKSFDPWSPTAFVPPLNDTGLDWCANASQNNLACPVSGFPGQDAESGRDVTHNDDSDGQAGFSFTKIANSGNVLPNSAVLGSGANDWACTRDNVTSLIWEVKTDNGGLRDKDWTYSWYNPDAATNGGSAGYADDGNNCFTTARCDTDKYVADVNSQGLCGASDWRLPNRFELESLTSNDRYNPAIDTAFFPNTPSDWFWSSSPNAEFANNAWGVDFYYGYVTNYTKFNELYVRLVRGGQ